MDSGLVNRQLANLRPQRTFSLRPRRQENTPTPARDSRRAPPPDTTAGQDPIFDALNRASTRMPYKVENREIYIPQRDPGFTVGDLERQKGAVYMDRYIAPKPYNKKPPIKVTRVPNDDPTWGLDQRNLHDSKLVRKSTRRGSDSASNRTPNASGSLFENGPPNTHHRETRSPIHRKLKYCETRAPVIDREELAFSQPPRKAYPGVYRRRLPKRAQ